MLPIPEIVGAPWNTIEAQDDDVCEVPLPDCDIDIDKQVSCDGGETWHDVGFHDSAVDSCAGSDGPAQIQVRYLAQTDSTDQLFNCSLTDSNDSILPIPLNPLGETGIMPQALPPTVVYQTALLECSEALTTGEPGVATLTCECFASGSGTFGA